MNTPQPLSHSFIVELEKKEYVSNLILSDDKKNKVLISGNLGQVIDIIMIEEMVLEFRFTMGRIRIDLNRDEFLTFLCKIYQNYE